jgi:hypothetical protein
MYANKFNVQVFVELLSLKYPMYIHHAILIIIFLEIKSVEQLTPFILIGLLGILNFLHASNREIRNDVTQFFIKIRQIKNQL